MYLYSKLQNLKKPIRVAFIGCGKFVSIKKETTTPNPIQGTAQKDATDSSVVVAAKAPTTNANRRSRTPTTHAAPTRADLTRAGLHNRVQQGTEGGKRGPNSKAPNHKGPKRSLVGALPIVCSGSEQGERFLRFGLVHATPRQLLDLASSLKREATAPPRAPWPRAWCRPRTSPALGHTAPR